MVMGELSQETELLVIGSGPGGYAAAFRAADLGMEVTMVDAAGRPGGLCLHRGCIPSKSLLFLSELIHDAQRAEEMGLAFGKPKVDLNALRQWKSEVIAAMANGLEQLCRQRGVQFLNAHAAFDSSRSVRLQNGDISRIQFKKAIIATGTHPIPLNGSTFLPGTRIMSSRGALELADIPRQFLVIGGGYVGLEIGMIYAALGSRVSLVELGDRLLPGVDLDLVTPLQKRLNGAFKSLQFNSKVTALEEDKNKVTAIIERPEGSTTQRFDRSLVAIGRYPAIDGLGLENTDVQLNAQGFVDIDDCQRTADEHIFAVGDVTGGVMLAHKATRQGKVAAEVIAGLPSAFDVRAIPAVVYTDPQIAWCGITEEVAQAHKIPVTVRRFPWKLSGRAATMGLPQGLTKIMIDPESGRIIGAGMVGRNTEGLISEAVLAIEMGALAEDLALSIHPHPTLSETEAEAAELYLGNATHIISGKINPS